MELMLLIGALYMAFSWALRLDTVILRMSPFLDDGIRIVIYHPVLGLREVIEIAGLFRAGATSQEKYGYSEDGYAKMFA